MSIILKPIDLRELFICRVSSQCNGRPGEHWAMKPGGLALVKAWTRIFQPEGKLYLPQLTP